MLLDSLWLSGYAFFGIPLLPCQTSPSIYFPYVFFRSPCLFLFVSIKITCCETIDNPMSAATNAIEKYAKSGADFNSLFLGERRRERIYPIYRPFSLQFWKGLYQAGLHCWPHVSLLWSSRQAFQRAFRVYVWTGVKIWTWNDERFICQRRESGGPHPWMPCKRKKIAKRWSNMDV